MSKKAYIFLADGFEDIEGLTVVDLLRRAGIDIKTISIKETTRIQTSHGITMLTDAIFAETDFAVCRNLLSCFDDHQFPLFQQGDDPCCQKQGLIYVVLFP